MPVPVDVEGKYEYVSASSKKQQVAPVTCLHANYVVHVAFIQTWFEHCDCKRLAVTMLKPPTSGCDLSPQGGARAMVNHLTFPYMYGGLKQGSTSTLLAPNDGRRGIHPS